MSVHSQRPVHRWGLAPAAAVLVVLAGCASTRSTPVPAPLALPAPAVAAGAAPTEAQRFAQWVADFRASARSSGIDDATLAAAFDGVQYRPRLLEQDRAQPEFVRPVWDYLDSLVSAQRIEQGRAAWVRVQAEADAAAARYGVPAPVLVAIWGIESNFGSVTGDVPTIDALATLGFEGRRADWARSELMAALKILQERDVDRGRMVGSWAGAMGQTQFLPSTFLTYAVDADGDGRRDIWDSPADVMASIANMLSRSGWRPGEPWGVEVRLPPGFDAGRADASVQQSASQWAAEGVRGVDGGLLPAMDGASLLLPAGVRGPAFMVGANFRAVLRYNNATSYALAVGLLSQRIAGGPGVQADWPRDLQPLTREQVQQLQAALEQHGFDCGAADGRVGPATRAALRAYQYSVGLPADGYPTLDVLHHLQAPAPSPEPAASEAAGASAAS